MSFDIETVFASDVGRYGHIALELAARAKPTNTMTPLEWAEFEVLDAALRLEDLKAKLLYVRCTGHASVTE